MNEWLDDRLRSGAERAVGDVVLEHPGADGGEPVDLGSTVLPDDAVSPATAVVTSDARGSRRAPLLAVAAALVALVIIGAWFVARSPSSTVESTDPAGEPVDSPGVSAPELVAAAIEETLSTSWLATVSDQPGSPSSSAMTVAYQPPAPAAGRPYAAVRMESSSTGSSVVALSGAPRVVTACTPEQPAPCRPDAWLDRSVSQAGIAGLPVEEMRARSEAGLTGLGLVDSAGAEPTGVPGTFAVTLTRFDEACDAPGCRGTVEIRDGRVVALTVGSDEEGRTWEYGSFGDHLAVVEPGSEDIVAAGADRELVCSVIVGVGPGTDPDAVEREIRDWIDRNGRESTTEFVRFVEGLSGPVVPSQWAFGNSCGARPVEVVVEHTG